MLGRLEPAEQMLRRTIHEYDQLTELPDTYRQNPMSAKNDLALVLSQRGHLASAEAKYITGQVLAVDGGMVM